MRAMACGEPAQRGVGSERDAAGIAARGNRLPPTIRILLPLVLAAGACKPPPDPDIAVPLADPERGRRVIERVGCGACHTIAGIRWPQGKAGPRSPGCSGAAHRGASAQPARRARSVRARCARTGSRHCNAGDAAHRNRGARRRRLSVCDRRLACSKAGRRRSSIQPDLMPGRSRPCRGFCWPLPQPCWRWCSRRCGSRCAAASGCAPA